MPNDTMNTQNSYGKCPICGCELDYRNTSTEIEHFKCPSCGFFNMPEVYRCINLADSFHGKNHIIAGYLYETKHRRETFLRVGQSLEAKITNETVDVILKSPRIPKTSMERLEKFLLNLYLSGEGFKISFNLLVYGNNIYPAIGYAKDEPEIRAMVNALCELGWLSKSDEGIKYSVTIRGLEKAENLLKTNANSKKVFIAMSFSDESKYNYKWKEIRDSAIKPAAEDCGFDANTVDETQHNDDIPDRIIAEIKRSRFVISDFTGNNRGVYYEAGYAKGLGIPVIKTCNKDWFDDPITDSTGTKINKLHFDIEHDNLILWKSADDLKEKLKDRINALF